MGRGPWVTASDLHLPRPALVDVGFLFVDGCLTGGQSRGHFQHEGRQEGGAAGADKCSLTFSYRLLSALPALPANTQLSLAFTDLIKALPIPARSPLTSSVSLSRDGGVTPWSRQGAPPPHLSRSKNQTHFGVTSPNEATKTIIPGLICFKYSRTSSSASPLFPFYQRD